MLSAARAAWAAPQPDAGVGHALPPHLVTVGDATPGTRADGALAAADRQVLQKLHDANQMEIQMGQLAQDRGSSKAVREFGRKLATDHTAADKKIADYLRGQGLDLAALATTTSADADHELLAIKSGAEFDRAFALQMIADHQKALDTLNSARIATGDAQLRALYDDFIPILEAHRKTARALASAKGGA